MNKEKIIKHIRKSKLIAIVRENDSNIARKIINSAIIGGIDIIEITMNTQNAVQLIQEIKKEHKEVIIGAGTVLNKEEAENALNAGADFLVSPVLDIEIAKICNINQTLIIPGVMTPNEIIVGIKNGINIFKLFPSSNFKPTIIKELKNIFAEIEIMPTGGINDDNIGEWIENGAIAVGVGSFLSSSAKELNNFDKVTEMARYLKLSTRME